MGNHLSYEGHTYGRNNGGWFNLTQQQNPFSTLNMKAGGIGDSIASRATTMVGGLIGNAISGGLESGAGNVLSGLGDIASAIPVYGKFAGPALKVLAGGANALIGTSVDAAKKASNDAGINYYNSYAGNATSTDDMRSLTAQANYQDAYKGGVLKKGWASRKNGIAQMHFNDAKSFAQRSQDNNADNILQDQISSGLATYSAFGGPLNMINNDNMGAIEYGFMSDWLANKRAKEDRLKDNANSLVGGPLSTWFAEGGKIEIKHPGRLTALKKRTGKTEAELYNDGNPAHKKMVVFARNSRRWSKHALGGYLKGNVYDIPEEEINKLIAAGYEVEYL